MMKEFQPTQSTSHTAYWKSTHTTILINTYETCSVHKTLFLCEFWHLFVWLCLCLPVLDIWSGFAPFQMLPKWQPQCGGNWPEWEPTDIPKSQTPASVMQRPVNQEQITCTIIQLFIVCTKKRVPIQIMSCIACPTSLQTSKWAILGLFRQIWGWQNKLVLQTPKLHWQESSTQNLVLLATIIGRDWRAQHSSKKRPSAH